MLTGPILIVIFLVSITILLVSIIKFRLNAFLSLLLTAIITAFLVKMPLGDIGANIAGGFGGTLGGIGIVTGLGVMLGKFLHESGSIEVMANSMIDKFGEEKSPLAITMSGFITGIPVFGDVVYVMFAPMIRALSKKTGICQLIYVGGIAVAASCAFSVVIPTPAPLAVAEIFGLDIGIFFFYAFIVALVGSLAGLLWAYLVVKRNEKKGKVFVMEEVEEEKVDEANTRTNYPSAPLAFSVLIVPILLILVGSFGNLWLPEGSTLQKALKFIGDKNVAMLIGVFYAIIALRKYIEKPIIVVEMVSKTDVAPALVALAICAGAVGLSLPNDSGFWAISRFNRISVEDTLTFWSFGGFFAGIMMLLTIFLLSLGQGFLPGL